MNKNKPFRKRFPKIGKLNKRKRKELLKNFLGLIIQFQQLLRDFLKIYIDSRLI